MTDNQDTRGAMRLDEAGARVAGLASRAIAELALRRNNDRPPLSERLLEELVAATLESDEARLGAAVTDILHSGIPKNEIVDHYIPEAARCLGDRWCDDGLGFAHVTIGTARLQRVVRDLSPDPRDTATAGQSAASLLIVVREGEHHTLGAMLAANQIRRAGLSVKLMLSEPDRSVLKAIATGDFAATLFSVGAAEKLAGFRDFIAKSRENASKKMIVGVGGAVGHLGEEARRRTGADFASTDAREAVRRCGLTFSAKADSHRTSPVKSMSRAYQAGPRP